jgi:cytochrome P450
MSATPRPDWDPRSVEVQRDQLAAYDAMRERCPVAYSEFLGWSIFRHADVLRVLNDHTAFSNVVSSHRAVPSGMDPPESPLDPWRSAAGLLALGSGYGQRLLPPAVNNLLSEVWNELTRCSTKGT